MTSSEQKRRERSILDFYLQVTRVEGNVKCQERPDFVVTAGDKRIGVEITEYHQPTQSGHKFARTAVEAEWEKIRAAVVEYRDTHTDLENLSVRLTFKDLIVPQRKQHLEFIRAVHDKIKGVKSDLGSRFTTIHIKQGHPPVLRNYLKAIDVRVTNCYMEWDWNHGFAGVGTSDEELTGILRDKRDLKHIDGIDELHLVIAGYGSSGGTYIGYVTPDLLDCCTNFNRVLSQSDYNVVTILNYREPCIWRKGQGWSSISDGVRS